MKKRLSKVLAASGVLSRRKAEELIFRGFVSVNGEKILLPQTLVDGEKDTICIRGKEIKEEKKVYFLFNKPAKIICTGLIKKGGAKRVLDFFSHVPYRLFTVGRLDFETTGLLIVTNDGAFANQIQHPSFAISKEYLIKTNQEITAEHLITISSGISIDGCFVKPLSVKKVRRNTLKISLGEGKKHEVRKLVSKAGLLIKELSRIRIGPFTMGNLPMGSYRTLSSSEVSSFLSSPLKA